VCVCAVPSFESEGSFFRRYFLVLFAGEPNAPKWQKPKIGLDGAEPNDMEDETDQKKASASASSSSSSSSSASASAASASAFTFAGAAAPAKDQKSDTVLFTASAYVTPLLPSHGEALADTVALCVCVCVNRPQRLPKKPRRGERAPLKSRDWVQKKKDKQRKQGKAVAHDSKYTGRSRRPKF
jgi:hypothetical protein